MASINSHTDRNGTVTWRARVRVKGHKALSKTFSTRTAAKRWARKQEVLLRESPHLAVSEAHRHTLGEAIDRYLRFNLDALAERSRGDYALLLGWWKDRAGALPLSGITPAWISQCRDELLSAPRRGGGTLTPATVRKRLAVLSAVLGVARREWQWVAVNPFENVAPVRVDNARERWLDDDELQRLFAALRISESPDLPLVVTLALTTGARRSEILTLTWRDVDLAKATVTFRRTKNRMPRAIGLLPHVIEQLRGRRGIGAALVFPSPNDPSRPVNIESAWNTARRRARLVDFTFHDLRHSCASYLAMEGVSPAEIAAVLGHKTLAMVKRYAHLSPEHTARVAMKVGKRITGNQ